MTGIVSQLNTEKHNYYYSLPGEASSGVISRLKFQQNTAAPHRLESQEQASSSGFICSKAPQPLTNWREPKTGIVSRCETCQSTAAAHFLVCKGQVLSADWICSEETATHILMSKRQTLLVGFTHGEAQLLTDWRGKDRYCHMA